MLTCPPSPWLTKGNLEAASTIFSPLISSTNHRFSTSTNQKVSTSNSQRVCNATPREDTGGETCEAGGGQERLKKCDRAGRKGSKVRM